MDTEASRHSSRVTGATRPDPVTGEPPIISIVVPTYNRAHLLPRLLRSLLRQTDMRFDLVVVDDGSVDCTPDVVGEFGGQFGGRLTALRHSGNHGCNAARNAGVRAARAAWCLFVDIYF